MERNRVYKDAVSLWTETIKQSPHKARAYASLSSAYIDRADYVQGLEYAKKAIALQPDSYTALTNLAIAYMKTGVFDQAIAIDERLLKVFPSAPIYNNLGVIYYTKGDLKKALGCFLSALHTNYSFQETYFNLANVYLREGQVDQAKQCYLTVLSQYPLENKARYALIALYLSSKQFLQAQAVAREVLASKNKSPKELVGIGRIFSSKGYFDLAVVFFGDAVGLDDTDPEPYIETGKILYLQHRTGDALRVWQLGFEHAPHDARFKSLIAKARDLK
jgi:tetratricopeptide (TPR) repeat protein